MQQYPRTNSPQQSYPGRSGYSLPLQQGYGQSMPPASPRQLASKKPKRWPWIVAIVVALIIGYTIGSATHSSDTIATTTTASASSGTQSTIASAQPTAASKPTAAPKWSTTHSFNGNGTQKTGTFPVPNDWKLNWSCDLAKSSMGGQYNIIIGIYNSDGTPADPVAINTICKSGNTSGSTEEHQAGTVYLDVTSEDNWAATIQELK